MLSDGRALSNASKPHASFLHANAFRDMRAAGHDAMIANMRVFVLYRESGHLDASYGWIKVHRVVDARTVLQMAVQTFEVDRRQARVGEQGDNRVLG